VRILGKIKKMVDVPQVLTAEEFLRACQKRRRFPLMGTCDLYTAMRRLGKSGPTPNFVLGYDPFQARGRKRLFAFMDTAVSRRTFFGRCAIEDEFPVQDDTQFFGRMREMCLMLTLEPLAVTMMPSQNAYFASRVAMMLDHVPCEREKRLAV
jgi:hypothetical protein